MQFELDGTSYLIIPSDSEGIQIIDFKYNCVRIKASATLPQSELFLFLRKSQRSINRIKSVQSLSIAEIQLFDKIHHLKQDPLARKPFLKDDIIYTAKLPKSNKDTEVLKKTILNQLLVNQVGLWEERLNFTLDSIYIKQLPKNYFTINKRAQQISYAKRLHTKSTSYINFIVATSIFIYLGIDISQSEYLLNRYMESWKQLQKIYAYEKS